MDPNILLARIRELSAILEANPFDPDMACELTGGLVEAINDMDSWLSHGGFLPDAWLPVRTVQAEDAEIHYGGLR